MDSSTLFVDIQGASLHKTGERLQIKKADNQILNEVPLFRLREVWLFGGVEITNAVLRHALAYGPWIHLLTLKGNWRGSIGPVLSPRSVVRLRQYSLCRKKQRAIVLIREAVGQKIAGQICQVKKWLRRGKDAAASLGILETVTEQLENASNAEELRGLEGFSSRAYFAAYGQMFSPPWFFGSRNRRPPTDPVNALLSLGYTFLFSETLSEVSRIGLDPWIGYFHTPRNHKASLALDLMEPFRVEVDEMVLKSLNLGKLSPGDFEKLENGAVHLKREVFARFALLFGQMLEQPSCLEKSEEPLRKRLRLEIEKFRARLMPQDENTPLSAA